MPSNIGLDDIRAVYLTLPIAACLIDRSLNFVAANDRYSALMGVPLSSIIGHNMHGINASEHIANVSRDFYVLDNGGAIADHEIELGDRTLLVSVSAFRRQNCDHISAVSTTLQDITARKTLERELHRTNRVLEEAQFRIMELAKTDFLTGLANRRSFESSLEQAIVRNRRDGGILSIVMIDVDAFKAYNDLYGHIQGDVCLAALAKVISEMPQHPEDVAARYGGEEFAVILHGMGLEDAVRVSEIARDRVATLGLGHNGSPWGVVTLSIGVFSSVEIIANADPATACRDLVEKADQALYLAKRGGRNKVMAL